jgi:geranyl-CoA carboxylase beta subunit
MIKHGSKQIQALSNATVPQITVHCGASFGAGNYGMCGRGFPPALRVQLAELAHRGDGARKQAAGTMEIVMRDGAARKGEPVDEAKARGAEGRRSSRPSSARCTRSTPRGCCSTTASSTRATRAACSRSRWPCATKRRGRGLQPMQFGVARP